MRRSLAVSLIATAAVLSAVGCGSNFRADEVKANESLFHQLPVFPGARLEQTVSTPYREEEDGPVVGYSTRYDFSLPTGARAEAVASFFARRLQPKWRLAERLDGPVLNFRNGQSLVSINLESWRTHILEIAVDRREKDSAAPALKAPAISEQFTLLPCPAEPKSSLDFEGCAEHRIVRSDRAINETVRAIYDQLSSSRGAADRFARGEHAWLTYRRAVCESRADLYKGGSAAGIVFVDCVAKRNADHLKDVRAFERHLFMGKAIYVPGSFGLGGYGLRYKPTMLVYTGDGSSYVNQLRYLTYGGPRATAVGIDQVNDCEPSCGGGSYHPVRARVTFWHRTTCRGKRIYAMFKIDAPGARRYGKTNPFTVDLRYMAACPVQTGR